MGVLPQPASPNGTLEQLSLLLLLIFILLRKAKRAMVPNSMEANFKRERATGREREREREREGGGREGGR